MPVAETLNGAATARHGAAEQVELAEQAGRVEQAAYLAAVQAALDAHIGAAARLAAAVDPGGPAMFDMLGDMSRSGKKLRPLLAYWAFRACGGQPGSAAIAELGAALELFQASALLHDDLIDKSDTRRGQPSAHRLFAAQHRRDGWAGNAADYGHASALLLGDIALTLAYDAALTASAAMPGVFSLGLLGEFSAMARTVLLGQHLDISAEHNTAVAPAAALARALRIAEAKSASYSAVYPLRLGALLAGAGTNAADQFAQIGLPLGVAFQLRDDLLGVFGDAATTGKPAGDDIRQGKRTVPVELALGAAPAADRARLLALLGRPDLTDDDVAVARRVVATAAPEVEAMIAERRDLAEARLAALSLDGPCSVVVDDDVPAAMLAELITALTARSS